MRTLLITGTSSGFGLSLARLALAAGHRVIAADPNPEAVRRALADAPADRLSVPSYEQADPGSVTALAEAVLRAHPPDVLVNNAGYGMFGTQLDMPPQLTEQMFAVNLFGPLRLTQALLPHLRGVGGTVVNLSSIAGRMVFPESGFYAATKHAIEAASEALYLENLDANLRVIVVEPGAHATRFAERASELSPPRPAEGAHASSQPVWDACKLRALRPEQPPEDVAQAILDALDNDLPFQRLRVGADASAILHLRDLLGDDDWVHFMAWRLSQGRLPSPLAQPQQILDAIAEGDSVGSVYPATVAAAAHGFMEPWEACDAGRAALVALAREGFIDL